jgi:hypothetical protein
LRARADRWAAVIIAGKRVVKLNFGRREDHVLPIMSSWDPDQSPSLGAHLIPMPILGVATAIQYV